MKTAPPSLEANAAARELRALGPRGRRVCGRDVVGLVAGVSFRGSGMVGW
jgi:hypothetical protein